MVSYGVFFYLVVNLSHLQLTYLQFQLDGLSLQRLQRGALWQGGVSVEDQLVPQAGRHLLRRTPTICPQKVSGQFRSSGLVSTHIVVARLLAGLSLGRREEPSGNLLGLRGLGQQTDEAHQILLRWDRAALVGQAVVPLGLVVGLGDDTKYYYWLLYKVF